MKAGLPLYEGDSLLHYAPGEPSVADSPVEAPINLTVNPPADLPVNRKPAANVDLDLAGIELNARRLRAEYVQRLVRGFFARIGAALKHLQQNETEAYLAQSKSLEELEDRLRQLEREGRLLHI